MTEQNRAEQFQRAVLPHLNAAYNLARWLCRNDHDAEDIVQEATLRALVGFGPVEAQAGVGLVDLRQLLRPMTSRGCRKRCGRCPSPCRPLHMWCARSATAPSRLRL